MRHFLRLKGKHGIFWAMIMQCITQILKEERRFVMIRGKSYNLTIGTCFSALAVQAIVTTFPSMLYITFRSDYELSLSEISFLIALCFVTQIGVDLIFAKLADKIGYRASMVSSSLLAAVGFVSMAVLPNILPPFMGLLIANILYSAGSGITEAVDSPLVEACPTKHKGAIMSVLHSFYCWGVIAVALLSTVFFVTVGREKWPLLACLWAMIPAINAVLFSIAPMASLADNAQPQMHVKELLKSKVFWIVMLLLLAAGASEHSVSQWISTFAEANLGIDKTVGDLTGLCLFAAMLGFARVINAKVTQKVSPEKIMAFCALLAIVSYMLIVLPVHPVVNLMGCVLSGLAVGSLYPGALSLGSARLPAGGTAMFAFMAVAGDIGCSVGPSMVGTVSGWFGDQLKSGFGAALIFPLLFLSGLVALCRGKGKSTASNPPVAMQ